MSVLRLTAHLSNEQIKEQLHCQKEVRYYKYWQLLHAVAITAGIKAPDLALLLGLSTGTVYRIVQLYNKQGPDFTQLLQWGGRREEVCHMSLEEEQEVLEKAKAGALQGNLLVAKHLRPLVEEKTGCKISDAYLRDLMHRHHWTKKAPRPEHPNGNDKEKEVFKKKYSALMGSKSNRGACN